MVHYLDGKTDTKKKEKVLGKGDKHQDKKKLLVL